MDEEYQRLKDYALKLLSFRPRSKNELHKKLVSYASKKKIQLQFIDQVLADLSSQKLLNDYEFALWWKEQRTQFKPKGKYAIKLELIEKGIDKKIIDQVLAEHQKENLEFENAQKLAFKKLSMYQHLSKIEIRMKLSNLLARRGFEWETIRLVIDSILQKK